MLRDSLSASVELAVTDPLTGLFNRRYLETHLKALTEQAKSSGRPLSVLVADIDHFKSVNDTYGHAAGDSVLREFAQRLRRNIRGIDLVCRHGRGRVHHRHARYHRGAGSPCGRACVRVHRRRAVPSRSLLPKSRVTASVGLATLEHPDESVDALLQRADEALYCAKRAGRNRVVADAA